ncbi:MAG: GAF domain-containing protein [Terriglobales bacterium]
MSFESALSEATTPEGFCAQVAGAFGVRTTEVALLRLDRGLLSFIFPHELKTAGSIPISSSSAVAVHTVLTKKVELFNNFVKVKHVSVFETVKFAPSEDTGLIEQAPIQKLMSAPITGADNKVLGILQVCRKAPDLNMAGRDFTLDDLQQLESAAKVASKHSFMKAGSTQP